MVYWQLAIVVVVSYFIGNVNFARILSKKQNVDITKQSSGNPGATNMYRTFGPKLGYLTLLLDAIKGVLAALLGLFVLGHNYFPPDADGMIGIYACGLAAMVGHCFPVIYGFKGGKGVSTMIGVFLVSEPIVVVICFALAFVFVLLFKYLSIASLLMATVFVLYQNIVLPEPNLAIALLTFGIWVLTWWAHRSNIERLMLGKENPTNIGKKIQKDQVQQQKRDEHQDQKAERIEERIEKKEERAEERQEKKEQKLEKRAVKRVNKHTTKTIKKRHKKAKHAAKYKKPKKKKQV